MINGMDVALDFSECGSNARLQYAMFRDMMANDDTWTPSRAMMAGDFFCPLRRNCLMFRRLMGVGSSFPLFGHGWSSRRLMDDTSKPTRYARLRTSMKMKRSQKTWLGTFSDDWIEEKLGLWPIKNSSLRCNIRIACDRAGNENDELVWHLCRLENGSDLQLLKVAQHTCGYAAPNQDYCKPESEDILSTDTIFEAGTYKLKFYSEKYFHCERKGCFCPFVELVFKIRDPNPNSHVPLLLSPYSYTTYRRSWWLDGVPTVHKNGYMEEEEPCYQSVYYLFDCLI